MPNIGTVSMVSGWLDSLTFDSDCVHINCKFPVEY